MKRTDHMRLDKWLPWFAWRPTKLTAGEFAGWVWLRVIHRKRRRIGAFIMKDYSLESDPKDSLW